MHDNDHNKKRDSLEQFFRNKSGDYEVPYREDDWLKLEKKLDIQTIEQTHRKKMTWLTAAAVVIISMLGYFIHDSYNRIDQLDRQLSNLIPPSTAENPVSDNPSAAEESLSVENESTGMESDDPATGNNLTNNDAQPPFSASDNQASVSSETDPERLANVPANDAGGYPDTDGEGLPPQFSEDFLNRKELVLGNLNRTNGTSPDFDHAMEKIRVMETAGNPSPISDEAVTRADGMNTSRISAGLILSPDISTVGSIANFHHPGYKIGLLGEISLNNNLAFSAGIIQSKIRYKSTGSNHKPAGYRPDLFTPDETTGVCLILDIPITFKYNFLNLSRSRFFATAGISSYIMLNESYQFSYNREEPGLEQGWNGRTGAYWLSNAGFSIGYELDIHSHWSLRAEPFIKLPLQEVGWGNVRLYSMGSFVSFNYKF